MVISSRDSYRNSLYFTGARSGKPEKQYFAEVEMLDKNEEGVGRYELNGRIYFGTKFVIERKSDFKNIRLGINSSQLSKLSIGESPEEASIDWTVSMDTGSGILLRAVGVAKGASEAERLANAYTFESMEVKGVRWFGLSDQFQSKDDRIFTHVVNSSYRHSKSTINKWIASMKHNELAALTRTESGEWNSSRTILFNDQPPVEILSKINLHEFEQRRGFSWNLEGIESEFRNVGEIFFEIQSQVADYFLMGADKSQMKIDSYNLDRLPLDIGIAGYFNRSNKAITLEAGTPLVLEREFENIHDRNAIAIRFRKESASAGVIDNIHIGYVPRSEARTLAHLMDSGNGFKATVLRNDEEDHCGPVVRVELDS